jgi:TatD DNase family protein
MLIDSHCHLDFADFGAERDEVMARARRAGVGGMLTICTKVTEFPEVRALAEANADVWCSVGIHPHEAAHQPETTTAALVEMAAHPRVVGIGETGLDFHYDHSPRERQAAVFRAHAAAARESRLPLIVHTRNADTETAVILAEEAPPAGVIHCFSSGLELAEKAVELGFHISLSGIVTFKNAEDIRAAARMVPLDRLLVETDAPYLAPVPLRGKTNEPAFVVHTAACVAALKGVSVEELGRVTSANFFRLFAKAQPPAGAPCA